ncbi:TORTIFOLIA1-like protein 2 [Sarracenia purpurea var. burkii]
MFELKQRVVFALNKLADRDTYQIGVEELEKTVECLNPDGVTPFLSCILDTDSEQKSAVRKECIRLMGLLVTLHEGVIGSHLGKMVASIVKRLKDPDSVVMDACVETVGVLASKLSNDRGENDGAFVVLVKPLFEALGEQNKQVQFGAALCLARAIDNTTNPPVSILQRMLARTNKVLKNPHFMAKPAVIELNRSIIMAGGAPTQSILSAALSSIQEALKNSDWTARKAASLSLGEIASSGGTYFSSFKASCIRSLESCRFDKVKPVRDTVLQSLRLWRSLPEPDTHEPSEAGSSIKGLPACLPLLMC